jgi:hypothetical protein
VIARRHQGVHHGTRRERDQHRADDIEPATRSWKRSHRPQQSHQEQRTDGDVDVEHPRPAGAGGQDAAEKHPDGGARTAQRRPHAERAGQFGPGERAGDHRQGRGRHGRCPHPLQRPREQQHLRPRCEPRQQRGRDEQREPGQHHTAWAEDVCRLAAQQHQPAEHQRIDARHPRQPGSVDAEIGTHVGQRDRHHGDVDDEHQLSDAEERQGAPSPRVQ